MTGVCFLSAEIFGEQFLRVGRAVINGCTCNNFSIEIKRLVSVVVVDEDNDNIVLVVVTVVIVFIIIIIIIVMTKNE
jgi:hypothetical protein